MESETNMTTCRETYRNYLLRGYSTSPLDASIQFFATIGGGMEWDENGDLVYLDRFRDDSPIEPKTFVPSTSTFEDLNTMWRLENDTRRIKYEWVQANIDDVLKGKWVASYFQHERRHSAYVVEHISPEYAKAFIFPDNIQPDWAEALAQFLDWWRVNLRCVWGVDHKGRTDFWTPEQKVSEKAIQDAIERLYEIRHGEPYATAMERMTVLAKEIMDEADAEEKASVG
jgi:hypothetical protein